MDPLSQRNWRQGDDPSFFDRRLSMPTTKQKARADRPGFF
jgi:hypothetical protein